MKKVFEYIQAHTDDAYIFSVAEQMHKEGFDDEVIILNVIVYLNNLVQTKNQILNPIKVA